MLNTDAIGVVLSTSLPDRRQAAIALARELGLPFPASMENDVILHLVVSDDRLALQYNPRLKKTNELPLSVDFLPNGHLHPRLQTASVKDPLAKAVGIKPNRRPTVIDATCGLGMDGLFLAWLGCRVTLIERSPIIHALLRDGLARAADSSALADTLRHRVTLLAGDARFFLFEHGLSAQTVLLDPMYPHLKKERGRKKGMRLLRGIVGDDSDHESLFTAAKQVAENRVVVKRPKKGGPITSTLSPSHQIFMKSGRFDVYLLSHL